MLWWYHFRVSVFTSFSFTVLICTQRSSHCWQLTWFTAFLVSFLGIPAWPGIQWRCIGRFRSRFASSWIQGCSDLTVSMGDSDNMLNSFTVPILRADSIAKPSAETIWLKTSWFSKVAAKHACSYIIIALRSVNVDYCGTIEPGFPTTRSHIMLGFRLASRVV